MSGSATAGSTPDEQDETEPQQISAILASSSLTLIIHTSVDAVRMMPRPRSAKVGPVTIGACRPLFTVLPPETSQAAPHRRSVPEHDA